ncbi:MAG TPA: preprotein translocase subunit YajC [Sulfurimonas sp.]|jgi:preprotein translocase subunit YajC|nr:preprotein translocase subunit YajC [Sulfurimonas sp.]HIM75445.1 preprotein translocase subunit YajC [Campylobacterales bacterium]
MDIISQILPFVFLIAVMYFVIIRPQQNEAKAKKAMLEALKKGDKVITSGGFIVVISKVEEDFLSVKLNDDTIVKITKDAVAKKFEDEA